MSNISSDKPPDFPDEIWVEIHKHNGDLVALSKINKNLHSCVDGIAGDCLLVLQAQYSETSPVLKKALELSTKSGTNLEKIGFLYQALKQQGYDLKTECKTCDASQIAHALEELNNLSILTQAIAPIINVPPPVELPLLNRTTKLQGLRMKNFLYT